MIHQFGLFAEFNPLLIPGGFRTLQSPQVRGQAPIFNHKIIGKPWENHRKMMVSWDFMNDYPPVNVYIAIEAMAQSKVRGFSYEISPYHEMILQMGRNPINQQFRMVETHPKQM